MEDSTFFFKHSPDGIFIDDGDGNFIEANDTLCEWLGYSRQEFLKLSISDLVGKDKLKSDPLHLPELYAGNTIIKERTFILKDKSVMPVELSARGLPGRQILVQVRDITDRIRERKTNKIIADLQSFFLHASDIEIVYETLALKIRELLGQGVVISSVVNTETKEIRVSRISGLAWPMQKITEMIGFDLITSVFHLDDIPINKFPIYQSGKLKLVKGGIYALSFGRIPKPLARSLEKLLKIKAIYSVGIRKDDCHLGSLAVISEDDISQYITAIEFILNQAAITILRINAEEALRKSEEKYRQVAEYTSDVIWMMDLNMKYTYVSPSIYQQRGYTPEEFFRLGPHEIFTDASLAKVKEIITNQVKIVEGSLSPKDCRLTVELEHRCKDGSIRWSEVLVRPMFDEHGKMVCAHGVSRDITDRKQSEDEVREMEERLRLAFQTIPDSITITRFEDGLFVDVNGGFTQLSGITPSEAIGMTTEQLMIWRNPDDRARFLKLLAEKNRVINFESHITSKDGSVRACLMSASVIHLKGIPHIISITRDIENIKKTESELIQAKEKAEESSRLKTAFLNNISHEVRTPMNAILGFSDLLQTEDFSPEEKTRYFGIIYSNAKQLLSIIDNVLEISRMDSERLPLNVIPFSIHDMMDDIYLSMSEMVTRHGLEFIYSSKKHDDKSMVLADREKIRQALTGLIGNAIKFTPSGNIQFGYSLQDGLALFFVRDTGIGIEPESQEKIFERFYQAPQGKNTASKGTGLGLSIAKGLIEMMGGHVTVRSEPGKGSTFSFSVPVKIADQVDSANFVLVRPMSLSDMTILIAEDELNNFEYLKILLSKKVKQILWAKNGYEAISKLDIFNPNLVLMDLKMPVMDGIEATIKLKRTNPGLPVIALTAYTQPEEEKKALEAGCSAFISKPVRSQDLLEAIHRVITPNRNP